VRQDRGGPTSFFLASVANNRQGSNGRLTNSAEALLRFALRLSRQMSHHVRASTLLQTAVIHTGSFNFNVAAQKTGRRPCDREIAGP
jgi:hypothetical protein